MSLVKQIEAALTVVEAARLLPLASVGDPTQDRVRAALRAFDAAAGPGAAAPAAVAPAGEPCAKSWTKCFRPRGHEGACDPILVERGRAPAPVPADAVRVGGFIDWQETLARVAELEADRCKLRDELDDAKERAEEERQCANEFCIQADDAKRRVAGLEAGLQKYGRDIIRREEGLRALRAGVQAEIMYLEAEAGLFETEDKRKLVVAIATRLRALSTPAAPKEAP